MLALEILCSVTYFGCEHSLSFFMIGMGTYLLIPVQVSAESANQFGELVADPDTKELLHYTEKPETFVCSLLREHHVLNVLNSIV